MFKQATGLTFTDYLARVRVEKVKNLLLNPHKRISEAAFEAGFQSLSQFNRVFKKIEGLSPSDFRDQLHQPAASAAS
jgi:AraC-like DNA-binding protein